MRFARILAACALILVCRASVGQELPGPGAVYSMPAPPTSPGSSPESSPGSLPYANLPMPTGQPIGPYGAVNPYAVPPGNGPGQGVPPTGAVNAMPSEQIPQVEYVTPKIIDPKPEEPPPKIWEGSFEFGLDGTEGNSQNANVHLGFKLKRKTKSDTISSELAYHRNSNNSTETANAGLQEARAEHTFGDTPWTCFIHDTLDYDEFSAYHARISLDTGIGYQFIKNDATLLIGRFGGGASKNFQGPKTDFVPEMVFGLEGEYKLSKKQKLTSSVEYRPEIGDFTNWRVVTKAGWEILLDEDMHLSLKLGLLDRYDSNSGTKRPNDLDYTATILWSF